MNKIAVFDINETVLDLSPVRDAVDDTLMPVGDFTGWFQKLLQLSMTATATGSYADFTALAQGAFEAVAAAGGLKLPGAAWDRVAAAMGALEAYPDVAPGLQTLRDAGWRTVALTNSAPRSVEAQLERAGLTPLFDMILSVDAVKSYKPAAAPYLYAAQKVGADPADLVMVACHDWDLAGARAVGMTTAFITRPKMSYAPVYPPADLVAADFSELAARLIRS